MAIPTHEDAMLPVLMVLSDGQAHHRLGLADDMAEHFRLTPDERAALLPSGKRLVFRSRTGWALSYLKQAGLVRSTRRGWYEITELGREALASKPPRIDNDYLTRFEGFRDFRARSKAANADSDDATETNSSSNSVPSSGTPPDEALEEAYSRLRASVEAELLDAVKQAAPGFFEEVVVDLLVKMGYGGSRVEAARAIGRSGDGGIDGVIDEDRLWSLPRFLVQRGSRFGAEFRSA